MKSNDMEECLFCNLPDERIVDQCDHTLTVRDGFPVSTGHTLVIPKRHVVTFFDTTEEEQMAISQALQRAKKVLDQEFSPDGYNIGINNGEMAGQTVPHLHVHLMPRYKDDCEDPRGGVRWILPEKAAYWSKD